MKKMFTSEEDKFLCENIDKCLTVYDLTDLFNEKFPEHKVRCPNLRKRLEKLGIRKGTHNIRKGKAKSKNPLETVIKSEGHSARVKTEKGYVSAEKYFKNKYFGKEAKGMLIHLNGNYADYSQNNIALVSKGIYASLHRRKWIFKNSELTKTAILTVELLEFFPELRHNENQYYKMKRER